MRYTKYLALIGITLFIYILYSVGPMAVLDSLLQLDPLPFLGVLALLPFIIALKGWKQQILLAGMGKGISLSKSTKIWSIGFFYATVTPAKAGDFFRAIYLRNETGLELGKGFAVTFIERIFDVGYLFIVGIMGLLLVTAAYGLDFITVLYLFGFLLVFVATLFIATRKNFLRKFLKPFFNILVPEKYKEKMRDSFHSFYEGVKQLLAAKKVLLTAVLLTVATWFITIFQYYLIAISLNLPVTFDFLFWVMPTILLIEILPISFSGIGTRDYVAIFFLGLAGVTASQAVSFSLIILFLAVLLAAVGMVFANAPEFKRVEKIA